MRYLTVEEVVRIHEALIEAHGGAEGVRDLGLITSAIMRPQTGYYSDAIEEAAALWESLAMNHGFVDGNKRVAFAAMEIFLDLNGYRLEEDQAATIQFIYESLEGDSFYKDRLDMWLRERLAEKD